VVREEVGGIHPILGVRILRYPRHDRFALLAVDDGQLQLDEYLGKIGLVPLPCMEQRCCGLAPIYDLKVDNPCDRQAGIRRRGLDALRSGRDPVVVGKEHSRLVQNRCPYSLMKFSVTRCVRALADPTTLGRSTLDRRTRESELGRRHLRSAQPKPCPVAPASRVRDKHFQGSADARPY